MESGRPLVNSPRKVVCKLSNAHLQAVRFSLKTRGHEDSPYICWTSSSARISRRLFRCKIICGKSYQRRISKNKNIVHIRSHGVEYLTGCPFPALLHVRHFSPDLLSFDCIHSTSHVRLPIIASTDRRCGRR